MQVKKAITYLAIVLAFAQCARAEEIITESGFTTGTSFEKLSYAQSPGGVPFIAGLDDFGEYTGSNYWETAAEKGLEVSGARVVTYGPGEAYPYIGTERNKLFTGNNDKFLELDIDSSLVRRAMPSNVETNILLRKLQDGIYADTLVQLTPCVAAPAVDGTDKIVIWLREGGREGGTVTNLVITAGRYAGGFDKVERCDYVIADQVAASKWYRLTIRMIADITGKQSSAGAVSGEKAAAFVVYIDGKPVSADGSYSIGRGYRTDWLLPEARGLISNRQLFPCLAAAGYNGATEISRFAFDGRGAVDDVLITTERPSHVLSNNVFTLRWDLGVKAMTCIVSTNSTSVVTNEIDVAAIPRFRDFMLGAGDYAQVTVTNVVYDTAHDYSNGLWRAENGCTLAGNVFTYSGGSVNPIGFVASTRNVVGVGTNATEGCVTTFAEAKALAKKSGVRTIVLQSDMVITTGKQSGDYNDGGRLTVGAEDDIVLDLCGHTLQGKNARYPTIDQTGGTLCIMDSSEEKTGRVLPPSGRSDAVKSEATSKDVKPELTIDAGWYDGYVAITNRKGVLAGSCVVNGGSFTNTYAETDRFYLEQYVTNATLYFGLTGDNYWTTSTNGFIWCGKGKDARWDNKENWKGLAVPQAGDLAIFPRIAGGTGRWDVDFGTGVETKDLWLDADIAMSGTNEFSDVTVVSGKGRLAGKGTAKFSGALPGVLTDAVPGKSIRLGDAWEGTVLISGIAKATPLKNIMGWGVAGSKVEFAGVRGYLSDKANYALPYGLVLTDDGDTPAWRNDTGYTGSVVSFPTLEGTGTFMSPKNTHEILQVFQFKNVEAFAGKFELGGKRLLLGTGAAAKQSAAGHYTFAEAVKVRSGLGWQGVSAHFGSQLDVYGAFDDTLLTFTGVTPDVSGVAVSLTDAEGKQKSGLLTIVGNAVVVVANSTLTVSGKSVAAMQVASVVKSGSVIDVPAGSAMAIVGNDVIVDGKIVSTVANYYSVSPVKGSQTSYAVSFNEEKAKPSLADFSVVPQGGKAVITVANAKPGLWYGLQTVSSLAESWNTNPTEWKKSNGETVTFEPAVGETSGFFQVIMTDKDPNGGEE